jgi:hypothetical protein
MEVDSMHSAIEYAQKHVPVFITHNWMNIFKMLSWNRNKSKNADKYATTWGKFYTLVKLHRAVIFLKTTAITLNKEQ